jgi:hypothetical protein
VNGASEAGAVDRSQRDASMLAPTTRNLTVQVLRMKGVPDADIASAISDPAKMQDLLNQIYGRRSRVGPGGDSEAFYGRAGRAGAAAQPDQASMAAATPQIHPPFGWAGLPALLR